MSKNVMTAYQKLHDEADRALAARDEASKIRIQVGSATCEDASGANEVYDEFRKHIESSGRKDICLRRTGCTGRCSCEPIVGVMAPGRIPVKYEKVTREKVHEIFSAHVIGGTPVMKLMLDNSVHAVPEVELHLCAGERCGRDLTHRLDDAIPAKLKSAGVDATKVRIVTAGCFGLCRVEKGGKATHMLVRPSNTLYKLADEKDLDEVVAQHIKGGKPVERLRLKEHTVSKRFFDLYGDVAFFNRQSRVALRNSGIVDPDSLFEYMQYKGFNPLAKALEKGDPKWVIDVVTKSKLRGRGGAGYPTGQKWGLAAGAKEKTRYIICNADEGDPGAFMDRSMLEGDPFSVVEGMIIAGYAIGAQRGFFYIRAEYPMAIKRVQNAIEQCRKHGLLGANIFGSGFDFDLEIRLGAGAFVCGEETALIHSIEGRRGEPRIRPPYPTESGLWDKPTVINNVETLANIPAIVYYGPDWFARLGSERSGGTKVFALAGKVRHTGLVEVPVGTTLRQIVFDIGGGVPGNKKLKAIQTGGPAGGCIPEKLIDTPVDFDTLTKVGAIMGSGGMIIMDEDDCMVDIAKFFLAFSQDESCGKCTPCREGTKRMLEILERITAGKGTPADIGNLERLAKLIRKASLCGLGRNAPNPILSTLTHYREEYLAHVVDKRCPSRKCAGLIRYEINAAKCVGCSACARNCPVSCIAGEIKKPYRIDPARCVKCGRCFQVCKFGAVNRL
jgi:NADH:ubiquinone oxidoreductase subunit F (NADH-binding)/(2Fe-2S) ferredoxin/NAD-dependent dihydropyrimidine dehydrogenase PreA subunit